MGLKKASLVPRACTAVVVLAVVLAVVWAPFLELGFTALAGVLACLGLYEYFAMARQKGLLVESAGGILLGTLIVVSGHLGSFMKTAMLFYVACALLTTLHVLRGRMCFGGLAASLFGLLYVGWFPAHFVMLHRMPQGPGLVTMLVAAVALSDVMAYLAGSMIGKHKMAPRLSPNKTWEGAVGGFLAALAGMAVVYLLSRGFGIFPQWTLARYLAVGAVLSIVGQVGDLAESSMKRSAGVKDTGSLFPGHGGVLDRCDGFLFAAPALYYMLVPFIHG